MLKVIALVIGLLVLLIVILAIVFILGMRAKWPPVLDAVRGMNKRTFNRMQMKSAGTPGAYASIVRHVGRRSGREYETPVGVLRAGEALVIVLPYGTRPDWFKNVLAAGSATIVTEGQTHRVERPEVRPIASAAEYFSAGERRTQRLFGVDQALWLQIAA